MLSVEQVLSERYSGLFSRNSRLITRPLLTLLRILFHEREINRFLVEKRNPRGFDFIERVLEYFDLDYMVSSKDLENIPPSGRVVVANDLLSSLEPRQDILLPVDNLGGGTCCKGIRLIHEARCSGMKW